MTLEELIERAIAGDGEAFTQLMEGQKQTLYKVARSYLHSDADAADAMGDTVLACWEKLPQLRQPAYFRTWLTRILIRKCQDILRQRRRVVPLEGAPEPAGEEPGHARAEFLALLDSLDGEVPHGAAALLRGGLLHGGDRPHPGAQPGDGKNKTETGPGRL